MWASGPSPALSAGTSPSGTTSTERRATSAAPISITLNLRPPPRRRPSRTWRSECTGYYTPEQEGGGVTATEETGTIEGTIAYTFPAVGIFTPTISGLYGYTEATEGTGWFLGEDSYSYWNAGLKLAVEKWAFDFRYWDTDNDAAGDGALADLADERFVFSAAITLP